MSVTYDEVKERVFGYHRRNSHFSFHKHDDPDYVAVLEMGSGAAPHLFRLMQEHPFESVHFAYHAIPRLIDPPEHIVKRMNEEALSKPAEGFVGLSVPKMEEIYRQWGQEIGALV